MSAIEERTVPAALTRAAQTWPERRFLEDAGAALTYAEALHRTLQMATGLADIGVRAGHTVLVMMDNHCDFPITWFAINHVGATMVTVNTAYKGDSLRYIIEGSQAETLVIDAHYVERVRSAVPKWRPLRTVIRSRGKPQAGFDSTPISFEEIFSAKPAQLPSGVKASDASAIIYTSGTTGRSKGVVIPHGLMINYSDPRHHPGAVAGDVVLLVYPIYYVGGPEVILNAVQAGATVAILPRFSASTFWEVAAKRGATYVPLNGAMANFLHRQPAGAHDRAHSVRRVRMSPVIKDVEAFTARFGIEQVSTVYGLTECSMPLGAPFGRARPGALGWVRPDFDVRIFDGDDVELPDGEIGEIVVRPKEPWSVMLGYHGMPDQTAEIWRNLWVHTGDLGYRTVDGEFFFVDRKKDSLRRRGENVSSQEVESYVYQHSCVLECAVVPMPDEASGDDEIKVFLTIKTGHDFNFREFIQFLASRMPRFWVPRFVEIIEEMPKAPSGKIRKQLLRTYSTGNRVWDREHEGIVIQR
jgi:carnitine-CoA ligase